MTLPADAMAVLDQGFVRLAEAMGGDGSVVASARVSYGSGSKGEDKDRKLISYLLRHQHMTPFEHAAFQFHIKCPIFVMRQWIRHRAACIAGETELYFDLPSGPRKGKKRVYRMTVEGFHRKWHSGAKPIPHAKRPASRVVVPQRARLQRMLLRHLREDSWTFGHTRVVDIFKTGEKPVVEVTLEDGKRIRCTKDHRFRFEDGWKTLEAATGLALVDGLAVHDASLPRLAVNGRTIEHPLYRDQEWLSEQVGRPEANDGSIAKFLGVSKEVLRKWRRIPPMVPVWARIESIRYLGIQPTFDLTVEGPFHNYVANGIVTHNSYNEISARYTEVQDEFYVPEVFRAPDPKNKQSSQALPHLDQKHCRAVLLKAQQDAYASYQTLLKLGVAREIARTVLPVGQYTQFYWTVNARNLMHFLDLRADAAAQWEIQRYAEALAALFKRRMPWTWEAFLRFAWKGVNPVFDDEKARLEALPV